MYPRAIANLWKPRSAKYLISEPRVCWPFGHMKRHTLAGWTRAMWASPNARQNPANMKPSDRNFIPSPCL
jgi:hypothetical protein